MASGTITGTTSDEYIDVKVEWSSTPNTSTNKSTVTAALYYKRNNTGYETFGIGTFNIFINGVSKNVTTSLTITEGSWVKAAENTATVSHSSDGAKTIKISAGGSMPGTTLKSTSVSGTVALDTIPRPTTLDSFTCSTIFFNGRLTVKYTPKSNKFYNRCIVSLNVGGTFTQVTSCELDSAESQHLWVSFSLTEDELAIIYNKLPNERGGILRCTLRTYSDSGYSNQVGEESYKEIDLTIPYDSNTEPLVSISVSPTNSPSPFNSLYIQGHSKVKATIDVTTKFGATVSETNITVNKKTYGYPYESDILTQSGMVTVMATATDSRGYNKSVGKRFEVIPYSKPYVCAKSGESSIICARCDSSANFTGSGTYLKIKAKVVYSKVISDGVQNNYAFIKFRYRKEGELYSDWQTILDCKKDNSDEVITPPLLNETNETLDTKFNYQVQIIASDELYESDPITFAIPSEAVYMDRPAGGKRMGLGGYATEDGNLDVYWKTMARGGLSLLDAEGDEIPLDSTMPLPRDQVASDWNPDSLECGVYVVAKDYALKSGETVIMYNGVLIQMPGDVGGNVKIQLALPVDDNRNPMYRLCWYSSWSNWRSMKL